ncbi:MAG: pitrilysin family protein [Rhizobiaceae bacterium]
MTTLLKRPAVFLVIVTSVLSAWAGMARAEIDIREITSSKGVKAWLVEDYTIPLIAINFAFRGGSTQDPAGMEGLAYLMTGLFDEGAGDLDSDAFQEAIDDAAAEMRFSAERDAVYGSVKLLADQRDEALALVRMAINEPRFDAGPMERVRSQIVASIRSRERDPQTQASYKWAEELYGDHPYARRDQGTEETLARVTPAELKALHGRVFARDNLHVGIVGAIDEETARQVLDLLFGDLPEKADLVPVETTALKLGRRVYVDYDLPQTSLRLAWPGIDRKDPDFFAAYVMNYVLGGGTFSSRLYNEVREKRGLAYGINSYLINYDHAASLGISTATRSDRADETLRIILDEVARMAAEGPSEEELEAAKKTIIGGYAVGNLDSSSAVASTLVELQLSDLGIDYIQRRAGLINAVTLEQARKAAARLFSAEPSVMIVGPNPVDGG